MSSPHVYDKAKYHHATIEELGLPVEHAANHTVFFLRWLIERELMSAFFEQEAADILQQFRAGQGSIHAVYEWWDSCLVDDMLSDEGNAFARHYFEFETGSYIPDYVQALQGNLVSEFLIEYSESNYQTMRAIIDRRYDEWAAAQGKAQPCD